jgi:hypothetical protein
MFALVQAIRHVFSTKASRAAGERAAKEAHDKEIDFSDVPETDFSKGVRGKYSNRLKKKRKGSK